MQLSSPIRHPLLQDSYLQLLLKQQARELTGSPGWPMAEGDTYELLVAQIESDLAANGGRATLV